jgi:hypothetical protein
LSDGAVEYAELYDPNEVATLAEVGHVNAQRQRLTAWGASSARMPLALNLLHSWQDVKEKFQPALAVLPS